SLVEHLSYSPDGQKLLGWAPRSRMHVWDLSGGAGQAKLTARFKPQPGMPFAASWSPDGTRLALSWQTASLVCDAQGGALCSDPLGMAAHNADFAAFTPQGRLLVARLGEPFVELWEADGRRLFRKQVPLEVLYQTVTHAVSVGGDRHVYLVVE